MNYTSNLDIHSPLLYSEDTITTDSLALVLEFYAEYITQSTYNPLMNASYATSCPDPGERGMKDPITNIQIHSDQDFNNIPAGQALNPIAACQNRWLNDWLQHNKNNSFNDLYFNLLGASKSRFLILITEQPINYKDHKLTITVTFASGRTLSTETITLHWD